MRTVLWRSSARIAAPDEASPRVFTYLRVRIQEFGLEIVENGLVQAKLALQRLIGDALTLTEEGHDLIEDCVKVHPVSSSRPSLAAAHSRRVSLTRAFVGFGHGVKTILTRQAKKGCGATSEGSPRPQHRVSACCIS